MAHVTEWFARLVGGKILRRSDAGLVKSITPGTLEGIRVETDHPRVPVVHVSLDPMQGHHAHVFTRVMNSVGANAGQVGIPVIEVVLDPAEPSRFVRVCLMPDGVLVSTRDDP